MEQLGYWKWSSFSTGTLKSWKQYPYICLPWAQLGKLRLFSGVARRLGDRSYFKPQKIAPLFSYKPQKLFGLSCFRCVYLFKYICKHRNTMHIFDVWIKKHRETSTGFGVIALLVGESRGLKKVNRNIKRQITVWIVWKKWT